MHPEQDLGGLGWRCCGVAHRVETYRKNNGYYPNGGIAKSKGWKDSFHHLYDQPGSNNVGRAHAYDISSLQFVQ